MKKSKSVKLASKDKLIEDLRNREEDRQLREAEILRELQPVKQNWAAVEKHMRKMVRKALLLAVEQGQAVEEQRQLLALNNPSYMHVASIMSERTENERHQFGKVDLSEKADGVFTEDKIEWLIDVYVGTLKQPFELVVRTVERSREKFGRQFAKFEAQYEHGKFFTEEGLRERKEKMKLKVLLNQMYGSATLVESKSQGQLY